MGLSLILYIIGAVLLILGAVLWQKGNHLLMHGKKAEAIIFRNNFQHSRSGGTYHPVVRFLTDKQEWITQELDFGVNPPMAEGKKLQVIYDPENPSIVSLHSTFYLEVLPRLLVAFGLIAIVVASLEIFEIIKISN
jgi:hypothetical protein